MPNELEFIDQMLVRLKSIKSAIKKKDKLSEKALNTSPFTHSPKQCQKTSNDLNWQCMEIEKLKTDFARAFEKSCLDVDTGEKQYNPSGFHNYKG